jgi:hypothetical protein
MSAKMKDEIAGTVIGSMNTQTIGIKYMACNYASKVMKVTLSRIF